MSAAALSQWEAFVAQRFDDLAEHFPKAIAGDDPRLLAVQKVFPDWSGKTVLDLGCGSGRYWQWLEAWGASVAGLDISAESLKFADQESPKLVASISRLPLPNGVFDTVMLLETLQHAPTPANAITEAVRVLKPGGKLIIIDRNPMALNAQRPWIPALWMKAIDERRGLWMYPARSPVRERWHLPRACRKMAGNLISRWQLQYADSHQERPRAIRRCVPIVRPFYCLTGTKQEGGTNQQSIAGDRR